ncbi:sugar transporter [bacterium M00.F.Ca.ET.228.01.1.1]|uniref:polysaccharide biosynthesis/export family protein n=1 Tax=Paraburkholderia phenoliruptrix TaxID=252970 RepID=UPI001091E5F0|nr:polysaccharide biosynthesis/export family protein [Paraburkholderia phenoliruptrix]TGP42704.1 sugar transporter [bacterium M00.F.Ca.ET.228.01.1.1]TGR98894.1 sugar transporter [bacterium M00.F.Ca.ET.191.01.1.1]TGU03208.1 sugar transporter [bacterium M00.F.Ca.ET.155.01.1.1]MBW0447386.1 polysaccharide biosynthesis/export family protein [Paraburkholderia phenoliruptrix]MBW9098934.1 polysaccharide biosynthesis/export family protein [Paraburkholderia phenoliruptrix]
MTIRTIAAGFAAASLCACTLAPGPYLDTKRLEPAAPPEQTAEKFPVHTIDVGYFRQQRAAAVPAVCPLTCLTPQTRGLYEYRLGIGDQLSIIVWDHPELTGGMGMAGSTPPLPATAGASGVTPSPGPTQTQGATPIAPTMTGSGEGGLTVRVANNGTIFFPRVGRIKVQGMTAQEVQTALTKGLSRTIRDPQLDVRVSGFNSQSVQVTGNLRTPASEAITDAPLSVLDAINRAGGALPDADLQNVGVTRDGKRYTVDVAALLETGDPQQNVLLKDGDIIDVPDRSNSRVFVLGEVNKPTSLPMNRGRLTLADALTGAGSLDVKTGDPRYVYVVRGADKTLTPDVYQLDMTQVDALMLMTKFDLQPKDVVYVQVSNAARFNRALEQITPTLQSLFYTVQLSR